MPWSRATRRPGGGCWITSTRFWCSACVSPWCRYSSPIFISTRLSVFSLSDLSDCWHDVSNIYTLKSGHCRLILLYIVVCLFAIHASISHESCLDLFSCQILALVFSLLMYCQILCAEKALDWLQTSCPPAVERKAHHELHSDLKTSSTPDPNFQNPPIPSAFIAYCGFWTEHRGPFQMLWDIVLKN